MTYFPLNRHAYFLASIAVFVTISSRPGIAHEDAAENVTECGQKFLESLRTNLKSQATFKFTEAERTNWHFIPKRRKGVALKDMNLQERRAAHALLQSVLSAEGYLKATMVMSLEGILRQLEGGTAEVAERRDQEKYWFAVFGEPKRDAPWGFRVEGHHLSLNFTAGKGTLISVHPMFFGANPAEVPSGPRAGLRTLAAEEDLARTLAKSLVDDEKSQVVIESEAPRDVITIPGHAIDVGAPAGVSVKDMSNQQREILKQLINRYAHNLRPSFAAKELVRIEEAGHEKIHFAWAGSLERGKGHYYRIHGPTFIIEYDNTQNGANHIHAVWHSTSDNFGLDTLKQHYQQNPHD